MLVMEYVEGGDLWRNLASVVPTRVQVWRQAGHRVALDVARGLCFLHARSIACVHGTPALPCMPSERCRCPCSF